MPVLVDAEPFSHAGSTEATVLPCHGSTSTPASPRPPGEHLAEAGSTVRWPLLPGHETTRQECDRTRSTDRYGRLRRESREVSAR